MSRKLHYFEDFDSKDVAYIEDLLNKHSDFTDIVRYIIARARDLTGDTSGTGLNEAAEAISDSICDSGPMGYYCDDGIDHESERVIRKVLNLLNSNAYDVADWRVTDEDAAKEYSNPTGIANPADYMSSIKVTKTKEDTDGDGDGDGDVDGVLTNGIRYKRD